MLFDQQVQLHEASIYVSDIVALCWYLLAWYGYGFYAQRSYHLNHNLISITGTMRRRWMREMLLRENRIVDAGLIGNLVRSITFFASTSIFVLFGLLTMLGYRDEAIGIIRAIPFTEEPTEFMWEFKIFLMAFMFVYAFFKYTWSLRLYNYASIIVGGAPNCGYFREHKEELERLAEQGGKLIANAGRHFNMGLRSYYFGLSILVWMVHSYAFIVMVAWVVYEVQRREFRSKAVSDMAEIVTMIKD